MLRLSDVQRRVGLGRSSIWRMVKEARFPAPRRLSTRAIGWLGSEIDDWLKARGGNSDVPAASGRRRRRDT
jgi:prophage regulatory protein